MTKGKKSKSNHPMEQYQRELFFLPNVKKKEECEPTPEVSQLELTTGQDKNGSSNERGNKRRKRKTDFLSREVIAKYIHYSQAEAASRLGVSVSSLKRRFYELGMGIRWPNCQNVKQENVDVSSVLQNTSSNSNHSTTSNSSTVSQLENSQAPRDGSSTSLSKGNTSNGTASHSSVSQQCHSPYEENSRYSFYTVGSDEGSNSAISEFFSDASNSAIGEHSHESSGFKPVVKKDTKKHVSSEAKDPRSGESLEEGPSFSSAVIHCPQATYAFPSHHHPATVNLNSSQDHKKPSSTSTITVIPSGPIHIASPPQKTHNYDKVEPTPPTKAASILPNKVTATNTPTKPEGLNFNTATASPHQQFRPHGSSASVANPRRAPTLHHYSRQSTHDAIPSPRPPQPRLPPPPYHHPYASLPPTSQTTRIHHSYPHPHPHPHPPHRHHPYDYPHRSSHYRPDSYPPVPSKRFPAPSTIPCTSEDVYHRNSYSGFNDVHY